MKIQFIKFFSEKMLFCGLVVILCFGFAALIYGSGSEAPWDVNQDGEVNVLDLVLVGQNFGTTNPVADVNGDGTVNVLDLVLVAQHFGESTTKVDVSELQNRLTVEGATAVSAQLPEISTAQTAPRIQANVGEINASPGGTVSLPFVYSGANNLAGCIVCIEGIDGYYDLPYTGAADDLPSFITAGIPQNIALGSFTVCYSVYDDQGQYGNFINVVINVREAVITDEGIGIFDTEVVEGHGLLAEAYFPGVKLIRIPDFATLTPFRTFFVANVDVPVRSYTQGFPELGVDVLEDFAIRLTGQVKIETPGNYNFTLRSDDGSKLYINGSLIIDHDGLHGMSERQGSVMLTTGYHNVEIQYFQGPRTHIGLQWFWQPPGGANEIVPVSVLYPPGTATMSIEPENTPVVVDPIDMSPEGMVLIPAGEFQMGSSVVSPTEQPIHTVYVDAFYMDKYEVTNAQYAEFLNAKGKHADVGRTWLYIESPLAQIEYVNGSYSAKAGSENHPVVQVSWVGAMAYAEWAGKRLPTEAEWEKAARGGLTGQKYPWGNTIDSSRANYGQNIGGTTAVGTYAANGYGLFDMCGNVVEWCLDQYNPNFYSSSPSQNPIAGADSIESVTNTWFDMGPRTEFVLRGGSWNVPELYVRVAARGRGTAVLANSDIGFRCVKIVPASVLYPPGTATTDMSPEGMVPIPAGEFQMGSNDERSFEQPIHTVYVDAFYMDKYEVTNAQYAEFLNAKGKHADAGRTWLNFGATWVRIELVSGLYYRAKAGYENRPVVEVSWYGAMAYAEWAGKRLPTEAEWEKAARGGLTGQKYPWGNAIDPSKANYHASNIADTTPVGTYPPNEYGLYDMAGNVWEYCLDEFDPDFYSRSPSQNPIAGANSIESVTNNFTDITVRRVVRGGDFGTFGSGVGVARRASSNPVATQAYQGFRCVKDVSP